MANPSRNKGTAAETALVNWLRANGYPTADRAPLRGSKDTGDITGLPSMVVSVKMRGATQPVRIGNWLDDLDKMIRNATPEGMSDVCGLLAVKRPGTLNCGRWYAIQDLDSWFDLYGELLT